MSGVVFILIKQIEIKILIKFHCFSIFNQFAHRMLVAFFIDIVMTVMLIKLHLVTDSTAKVLVTTENNSPPI